MGSNIGSNRLRAAEAIKISNVLGGRGAEGWKWGSVLSRPVGNGVAFCLNQTCTCLTINKLEHILIQHSSRGFDHV